MPLFSSYGDVPDISDRLALPSLVFAIVTPLFVFARLLTRLTAPAKRERIGWDDWAIVCSNVRV